MERRKKKADRKPVSKEQLQLWSDRILLVTSIILFILAVLGFVKFTFLT